MGFEDIGQPGQMMMSPEQMRRQQWNERIMQAQDGLQQYNPGGSSRFDAQMMKELLSFPNTPESDSDWRDNSKIFAALLAGAVRIPSLDNQGYRVFARDMIDNLAVASAAGCQQMASDRFKVSLFEQRLTSSRSDTQGSERGLSIIGSLITSRMENSGTMKLPEDPEKSVRKKIFGVL